MAFPQVSDVLTAWRAKKNAQWERVNGFIPGLQLVCARKQTQYMLVCSRDDFYEGALIGQIPVEHVINKGTALRPRKHVATEAEKPINKRGVDLTNNQIDELLAQWERGLTALSLPFVPAVWDRSGKMHTGE